MLSTRRDEQGTCEPMNIAGKVVGVPRFELYPVRLRASLCGARAFFYSRCCPPPSQQVAVRLRCKDLRKDPVPLTSVQPCLGSSSFRSMTSRSALLRVAGSDGHFGGHWRSVRRSISSAPRTAHREGLGPGSCVFHTKPSPSRRVNRSADIVLRVLRCDWTHVPSL